MRIARAASIIVLLVVAALLLFGAPSTAQTAPDPHQGESHSIKDPDWRLGRHIRPNTFMVGDSITHGGYSNGLHTSHPKWEISAVPGRDVCTLPYYLRDRMHANHPPKVVIIAMGTNACNNWYYEDLRKAVNILPKKTIVILVTTWRDPKIWTDAQPFRSRASVQATYTKWMGVIDRVRKHTCLANWRAAVEKNNTLVHDGVHPTTYGYKVWLTLINQAYGRCK